MKKSLLLSGFILVVIVIMLVVFSVSRNNAVPTQIITTSSIATLPPTPSPKAPLYVLYSIALPDGLLLTDAGGRRTGEDPKTGVRYQEIPNSYYSQESHSWQLQISQLLTGRYTIQVIGKHNGRYSLGTNIFDGSSNLATPMYTGSIHFGQVITYTQNYDPNNLASSTVVKN
jgi:hypothetical protein